jgi:septum formation protein
MAAKLILASTSPYRRALLERLAVPFEVLAPSCDEDALKRSGLSPHEVASRLARDKALSVARLRRDAYVLGSDQLVDLGGEILGKPGSNDGAVAQLMRLSGRTHLLVTAMALATPRGAVLEHLDVHTLTMRTLMEAEVRRYVARETPVDCAGSYKIESGGIALVERIEGDDFTAITGLPLLMLTTWLRREGFEIP